MQPATGYPYTNPNPNTAQPNGYPPHPPPQPVHYPYQNYHSYYSNAQPLSIYRHRVCLRRLFILAASLLILWALVALVLFLVLHPRLPHFYVTSLTVSNLTLINQQLSGKWDLQLHVRNPNKKMALSFDDVVCSVYYDSDLLAETRVPPFDEGRKEERDVDASMAVVDTYVERGVAEEVGRKRAARGSVDFDVKVVTWVGFRYGRYRMRRRGFRILCEDLAVGISSKGSGNLVGGGKDCRIL